MDATGWAGLAGSGLFHAVPQAENPDRPDSLPPDRRADQLRRSETMARIPSSGR